MRTAVNKIVNRFSHINKKKLSRDSGFHLCHCPGVEQFFCRPFLKMLSSIVIVSLVALAQVIALSSGKETQAQCTSEKYRLQYHFSQPKGWSNDPNGMVYYDGIYHFFYQYHPHSTGDGPKHWGHAISKDLVSFEDLGIALYPDEIGDIWSGSAVIDFMNTTGFQPTDSTIPPIIAIFTSTGSQGQRQSIAYSVDSGMTFTKYEKNPVLSDSTRGDFRDPKVHWNEEGERWIMALAVGDKVDFYSSNDLKSWKKESEFGADPREGHHGSVWECPDLVKIPYSHSNGTKEDMWVLIVSLFAGPNKGAATQYFVGKFLKNSTDHMVFESFPWSSAQWIDWAPDNYAGVTFSNHPHGHSVYMAWMTNGVYAGSVPSEAWRGQFTIPRQFGLRAINEAEKQYRLTSVPVVELGALRNYSQMVDVEGVFEVEPATVVELMETATFAVPRLELELTVDMVNNPKFQLCAYNDEFIVEETCFGYNGTDWYIDRSRSGNTNFNGEYASMLYPYAIREISASQTKIRLFLDVASLEAFADDGLTTMTAIHYPSEPFNRFYISNWDRPGSESKLFIRNYRIIGLDCWYPEV